MGEGKSKMRGLLRRWQSFAHPERAYTSLGSRLRKTRSNAWQYESETEEERGSGSSRSATSVSSTASTQDDLGTGDVPEGFVAVYVGRERRRFVIGAHFLNHELFKVLLAKSAEEYGFENRGGLTIACEVVLFEHLLWVLGNGDSATQQMEVDEVIEFYAH